MVISLPQRMIETMYGNHMGDWWGLMTIMPVILVVILAFAVYFAVRLGIRDGKHH